ncbi:hypothetical protein D9C73_010282 [Collichthys lucidus]|uniref:Dicer dsRNA-binding fold domain-containing protein n=1 Tax=Collichthys lucidus TaxID=240159 RepID=A0A4U5UL09_COLLU|nr:hypothetical protein D9C73_010282 [Collichthys lucidus]
MSKMTIVHLGVLVFAICLSTQVVSQKATTPSGGENATSNATTMATDTYSSPANTTTSTGAGVSLHAGTLSFLIPVIMAVSFLQHYC